MHIHRQIKKPELQQDSTLHVVGVISNPARYHSRYRLARDFIAEMEATKNVKLYIVEAAFGDRHFEVTDSDNPRNLQLRTDYEIWHKENMVNLGVKRLLPPNWKYVAWVDCDVSFRDPDWALSALHEMQHFPVIQPWSDCMDLGPKGNVMQLFRSFCAVHASGAPMKRLNHHSRAGEYKYGHSGYAWACTREFWEAVGGLMDFPILGSGDNHMAWAMIGDVDESIHKKMIRTFRTRCHDWERRAYRVTKGQLGFIEGRIEHHFHGPKAARRYRERWQILLDHFFDPDMDLSYDEQGMLYLIGKPKLQDEIRRYMRGRNEDSTEES